MSLQSLLEQDLGIIKGTNEELTPERIEKNMLLLKDLIAYWRLYPDKFVDYLCSLNPNNTFKFYYYQRVN